MSDRQIVHVLMAWTVFCYCAGWACVLAGWSPDNVGPKAWGGPKHYAAPEELTTDPLKHRNYEIGVER